MEAERLQILRMIAEGKVTAEEGARLLEAVERGGAGPAEQAGSPRWLRVRVSERGREKVSVRVPVKVVDAVLRLVLGSARRGALRVEDGGTSRAIDLDAILRAVRSGQRGAVLEVRDQEEGQEVEVLLE